MFVSLYCYAETKSYRYYSNTVRENDSNRHTLKGYISGTINMIESTDAMENWGKGSNSASVRSTKAVKNGRSIKRSEAAEVRKATKFQGNSFSVSFV